MQLGMRNGGGGAQLIKRRNITQCHYVKDWRW